MKWKFKLLLKINAILQSLRDLILKLSANVSKSAVGSVSTPSMCSSKSSSGSASDSIRISARVNLARRHRTTRNGRIKAERLRIILASSTEKKIDKLLFLFSLNTKLWFFCLLKTVHILYMRLYFTFLFNIKTKLAIKFNSTQILRRLSIYSQI